MEVRFVRMFGVLPHGQASADEPGPQVGRHAAGHRGRARRDRAAYVGELKRALRAYLEPLERR